MDEEEEAVEYLPRHEFFYFDGILYPTEQQLFQKAEHQQKAST